MVDRQPPPRGARDAGRRARRREVVFTVKPKIVLTDVGPVVRFELAYKGHASINVGFRMTWRGEPLGFDGPAVSLKAGAAPAEVSLRLPLDAGVGQGAKIKVSVVGSNGTTLAASSTGFVSITLPSGTTFALGAKGVVISAVIASGSVIAVATYPWGDEDDDPPDTTDIAEADDVSADITSTTTDAPGPAESTTTTEPPRPGWPVDMPREVVPELSDEPAGGQAPPSGLELFPFGRPGPLAVAFDERQAELDAVMMFDVSITYDGAQHAIGEVAVPRHIDPESIDNTLRSDVETSASDSNVIWVQAEGVPMLDAGTGSSGVCFDEDTSVPFAGYRTTSGEGVVVVGLTPLVGEGVIVFAVEVAYQTPTELDMFDGASTREIDPQQCPSEEPQDVIGWEHIPDGWTDAEANDDEGDEPPQQVEYRPEPSAGSLSLGDEGSRVAALQEALADIGLFDGDIDGRFGRDTDAAVRRVQEREGLTVDGFAGPATHEALGVPYLGINGEAVIEYRAEPSTGSLELGDEGERVVALQRALSQQGFLDDDIDGSFGRLTESAVRATQEAYGLNVDGIAGPATHQALGLPYP